MHKRFAHLFHYFRVFLAKRQALQVLSGLMQEDDENVELWYLTAVALNSLQPPDYKSARCECGHVSTVFHTSVEFVGYRAYAACRATCYSIHLLLWPCFRHLAWGGPPVAEMCTGTQEVTGAQRI